MKRRTQGGTLWESRELTETRIIIGRSGPIFNFALNAFREFVHVRATGNPIARTIFGTVVQRWPEFYVYSVRRLLYGSSWRGVGNG